MTTDIDNEHSELRREIALRQQEIEDRQTLIEVLAQDGHDVTEQAIALNKDRAKLATTIANSNSSKRRRRSETEAVNSVQERRKTERTEVDEVAYLAGDGSSMRCRVLNLSDRGAAIELPEKRLMRSQFTLMLERDRTTRSCRLIWSSGDRIGVEFLD